MSLHIISDLTLILPLVVSGRTDAHNLAVDQAVVSLGVPVGQVAGLGGEGLLDAPLLQQEAARLADDGPGDIRGNHDGYFLLQILNITISICLESYDNNFTSQYEKRAKITFLIKLTKKQKCILYLFSKF